MERAVLRSGVRGAGAAAAGLGAGRGDVERRQRLVRAVPHAHRRRHRGDRAARLRGAQAHLPAEAGQRRVDRHHGPDRAAGRLGSGRGPDARGAAGGRHLPPGGAEDLHHLRRARPHREHRPPGAGPDPRRAGGREGHLALRGAEVPRERGRQPRRAQRRPLRVARAQARHPRQPDRGAGVRRPGRRGGLAGRRGEPRPRVHVHHHERGPLRGRAGGRRALGARLPARPRLRARARAGHRARA